MPRHRSVTRRARLAALPWALLTCGVALASPPAPGGAVTVVRAEPWQADVPVPAMPAANAFASYRAHVETPPGDWRAANESVARIGGWRVYAREAGAPLQPLPPLRPAAATPPPQQQAPQ